MKPVNNLVPMMHARKLPILKPTFWPRHNLQFYPCDLLQRMTIEAMTKHGISLKRGDQHKSQSVNA